MVAATVANTNRDVKKKPKPYEPDDFFPPRDQPEEDSIEDDGAKWASFFAPLRKR